MLCGYIVRKTKMSLEKSSVGCSEDVIECLMGMCGDEVHVVDEERGMKRWCNIIDTGGLWHVSDETYELFNEVEMLVRRFYWPQEHSDSYLDRHFIEEKWLK